MYLIEEHIISKSHPLWDECDRICFASKNLYNFSLYKVKQILEETKKIPTWYTLYHIIKKEECFKVLPNDISKQVLAQVVNGYFNYFKALKSYGKVKNSFKALPKPLKFKDKENGRNVLTIPIRCCRLKGNEILFNKHLKLKLFTKVTNLVEVKISPQSNCYKIQVCYKQDVLEKVVSENKLSIDLGINNLLTVTNNFSKNPIIFNGKPLKSINQYFNKNKSKIQSNLEKNHKSKKSHKLDSLNFKRNNKIKHYLHNTSKKLIDYAIENNTSEIAIGYNKGWKQEINLGNKTNQSFTQIPFLTLLQQIQYKAELKGITVLLNEESYTSKCSALDMEPIQKHNGYLGKRVKRGLFQSKQGKLINADVNGSINIGRKVFGDAFGLSNIGCVVQPLKINSL